MNNKALTFVELLVVVVIMSTVTVIIFPVYNRLINSYKERICDNNILLLENQYRSFLEYNDYQDNELVFTQFLDEYNIDICPNGGNIFYRDGKVYCHYHSNVDNDDTVPYL